MMNSSASLRLLEAAQNGCVPYTLVKDVAIRTARSAPELLDELSYFVASQYASNNIDFEEADVLMNALWSVCVSNEFWADHDRTIPPITNAVYLAFDAGEFHRDGDPQGTDSEVKYTRPLIEKFLAEYGQTGLKKQ
jgi:hypothetical protein